MSEASKELLIKALGNLAREMLDELGVYRFRFPKKLLIQFLGEPNDRESLCWMALELGWIAPVGGANPFELAYTFLHPSFQAYFAAQVIDDWDFFLPRSHVNQPVVDETNSTQYKRYRVFEPQWKEVFLLWLGREDVRPDKKKDFLTALMHFQGGDRDFYKTRGLLLAAAATAEFRELYQYKKLWTKESLKKLRDIFIPRASSPNTIEEFLCKYLIDRAGGYFDEKEFEFYRYPIAVEEAAKSTLLEMDEQVVCPTLVEEYWAIVDLEIPQKSYPHIRQLSIASLLDQISHNSLEAQKIREHFLLTSPSNDELLLPLLYYFPNWVIDLKIENIDLRKRIEKVFQLPLDLYVKTLKTAEEYFQRQGLDHKELSSTTFINKEQLESLLELLGSCSNLDSVWRAKEILGQLDPTDPEIEEILREYCLSDNEFSCEAAASTLGKIYADSSTAVFTALFSLILLIERSENPSIFEKALKSIKQILHSQDLQIIATFLTSCNTYFSKPAFRNNTNRYSALYSIIFYCAEKLPYVAFYNFCRVSSSRKLRDTE